VTLQTRSVTNKRQRTDQLVEAPIFHASLHSQPRVSVRRSVHLEVYEPMLFQRIRNASKVTRPIIILANW
jgi:hypothetical protein